MEEKIDKLDLLKIKSFSSEKDTVKRIERQATAQEKILIKHISDKGQVSKIYKEFLTIRKQTTQFKSGQNICSDTSPENMSNNHKKRCSVSFLIRELQIKTALRYC